MQSRLKTLDAVWLREVARVAPEWMVGEQTPPDWGAPVNQRQRLFEALARAMIAQDDPLLLFLDDLQWCDYVTGACGWCNGHGRR